MFRAPSGKVDAKTALRSGAHLLETELAIEKGNALGRAGRAVEDPLLRTNLSLRAFWRRGTT